MTNYWIYVLPFVGGLFLYGIIYILVRLPGANLRREFASLGLIQGKTYSEILVKCGPPKSTSTMPNGQILRQWMASGYHIALLFNEEDICLGVKHEFSA